MAAASSFQKMKARIELIHWVDVFHNMEPERAPSKIGCCLTMLMVPVILIYAVVWFAEHQRMPPTETLVIDWSVAYGPFPMKVQCIEVRSDLAWSCMASSLWPLGALHETVVMVCSTTVAAMVGPLASGLWPRIGLVVCHMRVDSENFSHEGSREITPPPPTAMRSFGMWAKCHGPTTQVVRGWQFVGGSSHSSRSSISARLFTATNR